MKRLNPESRIGYGGSERPLIIEIQSEETMADTRITILEDGPVKVEAEGALEITDHDGNPVPHREGRALFLCRCGGSRNKPFCDGTHSKIGFAGAEAAVKAHQEGND